MWIFNKRRMDVYKVVSIHIMGNTMKVFVICIFLIVS